MVNIQNKPQTTKAVSEKVVDTPAVLFIPSNVENKGGCSSKTLKKFHCILGDRFGRDRKFYPNTKDENGMTPLHYAAQLLPSGDDFWGEPVEEQQMWQSLLRGLHKDDLNEQDDDGRTPMSYAAVAGDAWVVNKLFEAGADPYQSDKNGRSPLSWAAQCGGKEIIKLLSWNIRYFNDKDNRGWTPFHYFLQREPEPTEEYDLGVVPLIWDKRHSREVEYSHWRKAVENPYVHSRVPADYMSTSLLSEPDAFGITFLSRAVQLDRILIIAILLTIEDIDIGMPDRDGKTPLWRAIEAGNRAIAELLWKYDDVTLRLLSTGAHARSEHLDWLTAFHIMLDIPNIGVMEHHLQQAIVAQVPDLPMDTVEAPTNVSSLFLEKADRRGLTPLALAKEKRLLPIVKLFLRWRAKVDCFKHKADWFNLLPDSKNMASFCNMEETYRNVSFELVRKKNNILVFDFYQAEDVTPQGHLVERCDMLQHLCYSYSRVHLDTKLSEITCVLTAEFPKPDAGFFKRHSPFHSQGIASHKCWCISWTRPQFVNTNGDVQPVFYSSTISHGQIPASDDKFLQQYIGELFQEWSLICDEIETHVIDHCNGDETSATVLITDLADDSRYLATIQKALQDQVKGIQKAISDYRRVDVYHSLRLQEAEEGFGQLKATITDRLDKQHERVRDLRQMEFARLSVEETVFMRRISLITFIFLPLMFASSLFGMNVNALQSNPDWRWYIVFGAASLLLTYALWKVSDQNIRISQIWSELRAGRAMKNKTKDCEG
ncbi:ankyrin [Aspergillus piperis CBS 112811]|uniref:Ankyrin n=1 Tax=Aspergillus piperis CBS 112811 TaxID=1448313 RepID=A0A8G1R4K6_9EURO|nr:ankyrin [Aspergillus piperis CBS 112811]RAH56710.1 ankyrin [Aspergillus piperis CBS 112811]